MERLPWESILPCLNLRDVAKVACTSSSVEKAVWDALRAPPVGPLPAARPPFRVPYQPNQDLEDVVDWDGDRKPFEAPHWIRPEPSNPSKSSLLGQYFLNEVWLEADHIFYMTKATGRTREAVFEEVTQWLLSARLSPNGDRLVQYYNGLRMAFLNGMEREMNQFFEAMANTEELVMQRLIMDQCNDVNDQVLLNFARHCLKKLTHLRIFSNVKILEAVAMDIVQSNGRSIKELSFAGSRCATDSLMSLIIRKCPNIEVLDITRALHLSQVSLSMLFNNAPPKLWYLKSYANQHIPPAAYSDIGLIMPQLKYLDLCGSLITNAQMQSAFELQGRMKGLNLTWCKSAENPTIRTLLQSQPSLTWLSCHGMELIDDSIIDGVETFPSITHIDLRGTRMTSHMPSKAFPRCENWSLAR